MKKHKKGIVYIAMCIDDILLIGNPKAINETVESKEQVTVERGGYVAGLFVMQDQVQ